MPSHKKANLIFWYLRKCYVKRSTIIEGGIFVKFSDCITKKECKSECNPYKSLGANHPSLARLICG
jgi:hypothetical protein